MKYVLVLLGFLFVYSAFAGPEGWKGPFDVRSVDAKIYQNNGFYWVDFVHYGWVNGCGYPEETKLRDTGGLNTVSLESIKSMMAVLQISLAENKQIKVLYDGSNCYANEIRLCDENSPCDVN